METESLQSFSVWGYALMVLALIPLVYLRTIFSPSPVVIGVQALAVILMVWARWTFGSRSFHFAADATPGGLVTNGPYRYFRHPIYAAVAWFATAGSVVHLSWVTGLLLLVLFGGIGIRIYCEEKMVSRAYPEYADYARRTKRIIPFVF